MRFTVAHLSVWLTLCTACLSCSQVLAYEEVTDEQTFRAAVVERQLSWPGGFNVRFRADGVISGSFPAGELTGAWQWVDGHFCRSLKVGHRRIPRECLTIEIGDGRVRFRRENGSYFLPYNIGPPY